MHWPDYAEVVIMLTPRTVFLLLFLFACTGYACAAEVAVCTDASDQVNPDVDKTRVVWEDHRQTYSQVYLYDSHLGSSEPIEKPPSGTNHVLQPAVSGDSIVYVAQSATGYQVRLYSIATDASVAIRSSSHRLENPDVHATPDGIAVVWTEYAPNATLPVETSDIYLYTKPRLAMEKTVKISDGMFESDPRISDGAIVWMHRTAVTGPDSYHGPIEVIAKIGTDAPRVISTSTPGDRNLLPDVSGTRTV